MRFTGFAQPLAVLFGGVLMAALDIAIVGPALPAIGAAFEVDARALSWVFSSYVLFYLIGAPVIGTLGDQLGRRAVFAACLALFAAGSLLVAAAPVFGVVLAGRAVQALGAGGIFPVASALIADTVPLERRGRVLGLLGATFGIAFLLGPLLGALLLPFGWQWLFLINVPVAVALIALGRRVLPAGARRPAKLDAAGAAVLAVSLAALVWAVNGVDGTAPLAGVSAARVWPFAVLVLLALPMFWSIEKRARDPVLPPALLGSRRLRSVAAVALAAGLVEAGMVFLPDIAVRAFGAPPAKASLMMLPLVGTLLVGAPLAGLWLDLRGPRIVVQAGLGLTTAGLLLFGSLPLSLTSFYAAGTAIGFGLSGLLGAPLRFIVLQEAGPSRRGAGQGLLTLFLSVGQLVGGALIGGLAGSSATALGGYRAAMLWLAGACAAALAASAALGSAPGRRSD